MKTHRRQKYNIMFFKTIVFISQKLRSLVKAQELLYAPLKNEIELKIRSY